MLRGSTTSIHSTLHTVYPILDNIWWRCHG